MVVEQDFKYEDKALDLKDKEEDLQLDLVVLDLEVEEMLTKI